MEINTIKVYPEFRYFNEIEDGIIISTEDGNAIYANTGLLCKAISKSMCKQCTKAKHTTVMSAISVLARQEQWDGTRRLNIQQA